MTTTTNCEKVQKWATEHPQRWKEIRSKANRTYYERNKEYILLRKRARKMMVQINES